MKKNLYTNFRNSDGVIRILVTVGFKIHGFENAAYLLQCVFIIIQKTTCFINHGKLLYYFFTAEYSQQNFNLIICGHTQTAVAF